jgi:hypothetical protein
MTQTAMRLSRSDGICEIFYQHVQVWYGTGNRAIKHGFVSYFST